MTANQVTLAGVAVSILGGACIFLWPEQAWSLLLLPLWLFLRMALNAMDGMLAREFGQQTKLGALLNELGDVMSDIAMYLPLASVPLVNTPLVMGVIMLALVAEMTGVLGVLVGTKRQYQGPMGKSDRAFWFGVLALLLGLGALNGTAVMIFLGIMLGLLLLTIFRRARAALEG